MKTYMINHHFNGRSYWTAIHEVNERWQTPARILAEFQNRRIPSIPNRPWVVIHTRANHHEAALTLLQQLLLTGTATIPIAINVARAVRQNRKKGKQK